MYRGTERQLEYDFVVAPGTDVRPIRLAFEGVRATRLRASGELELELPDGSRLVHHRPVIYQDAHEGRITVAGNYVRNKRGEIGFRTGSYNRSLPLIIDPVLSYSTYLGSTNGQRTGNFSSRELGGGHSARELEHGLRAG